MFPINLGKDREQIGESGVGRPHLGAVKEIVITVQGCPLLGAKRVRPAVRLAESKGPDDLTGGKTRQVSLLLLKRAEVEERERSDDSVRADGNGEGGIQRCFFD